MSDTRHASPDNDQIEASEQTQAIILSAGTELTEGVILNTHFRYLGSELKNLGFEIVRSIQIPDKPSLFLKELLKAINDSKLVVITGGLGPTSDDLTREIVAETAGVELKFQKSVWDGLLNRYAGTGHRISATNKKQAYTPDGFQTIDNPFGTAPGFAGRINESLVVALPGPPGELEPLFQHQVVPILVKELHTQRDEELRATALMISESLLEEALQKHRQNKVVWGTRVAEDRILITFRGGSAGDREKAFEGLEHEFSQVRIRRDDVKPNLLLFNILSQYGLTIALAESCTGGLIGKLITDIPGSSNFFWGSLVVYSNKAKEMLLGVKARDINRYGAVSREVVSAMSAGLLERTGVDLGLAVTGIAGPDPDRGSGKKPVGTVWISARNISGDELCREFHFSGNRDGIRRQTAVSSLLMTESLVLKRNWPS